MNTSRFSRKFGACVVPFFASVVATFSPISGVADTVSTVPVGTVNLTAAAGTGSTSTVSVLSFPLLGTASITGQSSGVITGVTANTISNSNAGWTAGALSVAASPYVIQITSGSAKGRTFLVSTTTVNTATAVTIDSQESGQIDLTSLGIVSGASGDTYSIFPCDTLLNAFGPGSAVTSGTTALGSTSPAGADVVQLFVSGAWRQYYYNTTSGHWLRAGPNIQSDNVVIRPDTGVIYSRLAATALNLTVLGSVPAIDRKAIVSNSGVTFVSSSWPMDLTLATSNIAAIPGWVPNASASSADIVQMFVSGAWRQYYYDGSHWRRAGPGTISDTVSIPAGTAVMLQKLGSATGVTTLAQTLPYSLN